MKSIKTLALVTGLMAISGACQAQFSSTWTAVSDYDFRGASQSAKDPALQGSADYAFGDSGFSMGAWASNIDFGNDEDIEVDLYLNYAGKINDTFSWTAGGTYFMFPSGDAQDDYQEIYIGFNAGSFNMKQWYSWDIAALDAESFYTEASYTAPLGESFSLAFHAGYFFGDGPDVLAEMVGESSGDVLDYAVQLNWTVKKFTIFGKFTGTDASGNLKEEGDVFNSESRFIVGVMTTFPWGD